MTFEPIKLPYSYDALEPHIDAKTMEIHYTKHHFGYANKLNAALEKYPKLQKQKAEELIESANELPKEIKTSVINNAGGLINHNLFWEILTGDKKMQKFSGKIAEAIEKSFGNFDKFKELFSDSAMKRFGSGWAWLVLSDGKLEILSTPNQDSPIAEGKIPLLCLDVWEHAYYLKYQNKRDEYIKNFWNIVNWKKVNELYQSASNK